MRLSFEKNFRIIALLSISLAARSLFAQPPQPPPQWILMTADFDRQPIYVNSISATSLEVVEHGKPMTVPLDQVLRLDRQDRSIRSGSTRQLLLANGDRVFGECGDLQNDSLQWNSSLLDTLKFPIDQAQAIIRGADIPYLGEARKEDLIVLANHDQVRGVVAGIEGGKILIQANSQTTAIPLANTNAILFASAPPAQQAPTEAFRIVLRDQSRLTIRGMTAPAGKLIARFPGSSEQRSINFDDVLSIEHINGPVSWLSDRIPIASEQAAFASDLSYPAQMDRNVFGGPLRFEAETFTKGIGVHANSKLTFALDGSYRIFRTRYAIDTSGDCGKADVTVRVLLDGKPVHVQEHVKAYHLSPVLNVDLANSKTLTLEVTAGAATDTQDRLDWLEGALVREAPAGRRNDGLSPTTRTTGPS